MFRNPNNRNSRLDARRAGPARIAFAEGRPATAINGRMILLTAISA